MATETDHVSPWTSVFRLSSLTDTDVTFVLTKGGHNSGILSERGRAGRHFRCSHKAEGDAHITAADWLNAYPEQAGSLWQLWAEWLTKRSGTLKIPNAAPPVVLEAAPGLYVSG